jgi:putative ABC transport system permease protein
MLLTFLVQFAIFLFIGLLCIPIAFLIVVLFWDKGRRSFVLAVRSLWLHKLRAFLSVLGIIIGTMAVILLMAFGEGSMQDAIEDIKRQGATNIIITSRKLPNESATGRRARIAVYGILMKDYEQFITIPTVVRHVPMRVFRQEIRFYDRMFNGQLVGTEPGYAETNKVELAMGRFFTEEENRTMQNRVVLGAAVAKALFPYSNPIGESIGMGRSVDKWRVVGVLKERVSFSRNNNGGDNSTAEEFNNEVYVPLTSCNRWYGDRVIDRQSGSFSAEQVQLHQVTLTVGDIEQVEPTGKHIKELMIKAHPRKDWQVTIPLDRLKAAEDEKNRFTMLLVMIGSISLGVGGIGIMNIMLATVTERTREIGIRRALGAKRRDITMQFLVEAMVQTGIGGIVGVLLGLAGIFGIPLLAALFDGKMPAHLHKYSVFLSLSVSIGVGVLFGWYPARRAALLDPIEALRHE